MFLWENLILMTEVYSVVYCLVYRLYYFDGNWNKNNKIKSFVYSLYKQGNLQRSICRHPSLKNCPFACDRCTHHTIWSDSLLSQEKIGTLVYKSSLRGKVFPKYFRFRKYWILSIFLLLPVPGPRFVGAICKLTRVISNKTP